MKHISTRLLAGHRRTSVEDTPSCSYRDNGVPLWRPKETKPRTIEKNGLDYIKIKDFYPDPMDKRNRQKDLKKALLQINEEADISPRPPANEPQTGALNVRQ